MSDHYRTQYAVQEEPAFSDLKHLAPELRKGLEQAELSDPGIWDRTASGTGEADDIFFIKDGFDHTPWESKDERRTAAGQAATAVIPMETPQDSTFSQAAARLRNEMAAGLSETPDEDPAAGTRAEHALEDYRRLMSGADPSETLEVMNETTARDTLLALAEARTGITYRYNGDAARAVASAALEPLRELAEACPERREIQDIAEAAQRSWEKAIAGSTSIRHAHDRPELTETQAVKSARNLTQMLQRGHGSVHAPEDRRLPEPASQSVEHLLQCAWQLRNMGESGFASQHLMQTAGRELVSDIERLSQDAASHGGENYQLAEEAAKRLESLRYLLRPHDTEYWPLHDSPAEEKATHALEQADTLLDFPQQLATLIESEDDEAGKCARQMVDALQEGMAARLAIALDSGQPTDYRRAQSHAEDTAHDAAGAVMDFDAVQELTGMNAGTPKLPGQLTHEGGEGSRAWLNAANSYIIQAQAACKRQENSRTEETLDTALTLAEMAKESLNRDQRESAGRMLRALDATLTWPQTGPDP